MFSRLPPWSLVVFAAACSVSLALGVRQTFGLFLLPLATDAGIAPMVLGLSVALHNLTWGLTQPFCGAFADRYGTGKVALAGGCFYAAGLLLPALAPHPVTFLLGIGVLTGIGVSGAGSGTAMAAVGRAVPSASRGNAMGLASAGGSFGQALMVPIAMTAIAGVGPLGALGGLALAFLLLIPVSRILEWKAPPARANAGLAALPALARRSLGDRDFALLTTGFFACGFQLAFLVTHLPAHLALCGLPAGLGATSLMLVGLFNIPGSWLCGRLGNSVRPELALGGIYLLRTVAIAIFASSVPTEWGTLVFAAVMGFVWLGTVPLTSAAIARRFGVADLGALYGLCFLSHQIGGFLGAGAASIVVDVTGSYASFWPVMVVVGLIATTVNWMARPPRVVIA
ncbi:MFS transporter [Humitalea sp. 24SJ18S-53]|uniref:MFS transporter n=1 Tax=Humitalea sp. 24SJ18S-53 TaxID=3422307 RepID=UPI003D675BF0